MYEWLLAHWYYWILAGACLGGLAWVVFRLSIPLI